MSRHVCCASSSLISFQPTALGLFISFYCSSRPFSLSSTLLLPHITKKMSSGKKTVDGVSLPPLRCPGGPRVKAEGLKHLFKVPHAGYLAKYDQRFILNLKLTHQIVTHMSRTTLKTHDKLLVELGPGTGALTRSLLTRPCVAVLGIEADERFNAHLEQVRQYTDGKFQWVNADVLRVNELDILRNIFPRFVEQNIRKHTSRADDGKGMEEERETCEEGETNNNGAHFDCGGYEESAPLRNTRRERLLRKRFSKYAGLNKNTAADSGAAFEVKDHWWCDGEAKVEVVANLPFSIITELLMRYTVDCSRKQNLFAFGRVPLHIFTQKEIAERIIAPSGSIHFSRLSVLCQCFFHIRLRQTFREMTYYPKTEVLGALLTLQPRSVPLTPSIDAATLIHFTDLLMKPGNRGITVHKALLKCVPPEVAQFMLQEMRIDGALTVLDLTAEEICRLSVLWQRFIEASSQQQQQQQQDGK